MGGEGEERLDTARAKLCYYAADSKFYYHLLSFLHKEIFSTPSDKCELNVLLLLSSWETLFLSMSPIAPRKYL